MVTIIMFVNNTPIFAEKEVEIEASLNETASRSVSVGKQMYMSGIVTPVKGSWIFGNPCTWLAKLYGTGNENDPQSGASLVATYDKGSYSFGKNGSFTNIKSKTNIEVAKGKTVKTVTKEGKAGSSAGVKLYYTVV